MGVRKSTQGRVLKLRTRSELRFVATIFVAALQLPIGFVSVGTLLAGDPPKHVPQRAAEPVPGTLFLCGGGLLGDDIYKRFVDLCGGDSGHIAIITTASDYADSEPQLILEKWRARTGGKISLVHTHSPETANTDEFVAPLRSATGVWIVGGKQPRLTAAYLGTKTLRELQAFQARGGVIGGSSAGAAVMSDVMLSGGTLEEPGIYEGFSLLRDGIVDQHFSERGREPRLLVALRRHPGRPGFGIDERTALIVRGRELQVAGEGNVTVYLSESSSRPVHRIKLKHGDREDLQALRRAAIARAGDADPNRIASSSRRVPNGSLVIVGGGRTPDVVKKRFIELAGGPEAKIAVVATGGDKPRPEELEAAWLKAAGAKNVVVVGPRSAAEANDPKIVEPLQDAKGIWFGGGRQWRFVDAFEATACYEAFCRVLDRGGVIGGSSAGATIQGEYLVRGSPLTNRVMMAEGYERGFGFLPGAAIDQHFSQRKRQPDMELLKRSLPQLLGLGIDEATAVVVQGTQMEVIGDNTVSVYPPTTEPVVAATPAAATSPSDPPATSASTAVAAESNVVPATAETPLVAPQVLKSGDAYDLERFTVQGGGRQ